MPEHINTEELAAFLHERNALSAPLWWEYCQTLPLGPAPHCDNPAVSVIIPAHNQWLYTKACLASILATCGQEPSYEILLVDDASTDETAEAEQLCPGLRVVRMLNNAGYIQACNAGAREAAGRYLLLLNNDTVVCPGWLAALCRLLESDARAGIAASLMLTPQGRVQDAGGILWNDGTTCRYAEHADPSAFNLRLIREIDFAAGTSLLIRKELWETLGGYDEGFGRGYWEDVDLALRVRAAGHSVVLQPRSMVIHAEHGTFKMEYKRPWKANQTRLIEKWRPELASGRYLPPDAPASRGMLNACRAVRPEALVRKAEGRYSILLYHPYRHNALEETKISEIADFLRECKEYGHMVHLVVPHLTRGNDALDAVRAYCDTIDEHKLFFPQIYTVYNGEHFHFDEWYCLGLGEEIASLCNRYNIDMVICSHIFHSKILEFVPEHVAKVILPHGVMSDRHERLAKHGIPAHFFSCSPEDEARYLRRADMVIADSAEMRAHFQRLPWPGESLVIPPPYAARFMERPYPHCYDIGLYVEKDDILLTRTEEFLRLLKAHPLYSPGLFRVHLAFDLAIDPSAMLPERGEAFAAPFVNIWGASAVDPADFYKDMELVVVPAVLDGGLSDKTALALAHGVPLLAVSRAGLASISPEPCHQLASPADLADALYRLVRQPEELTRLAQAGRKAFLQYRRTVADGFDALFRHPKLGFPEAAFYRPAASPAGPLFSVLMPVHDPKPDFLRQALDSVLLQSYGRLELRIADDASSNPEIRVILEEYMSRDVRVNVVFRTERGNICAASNSALELCSGNFVVFMDHDDLLARDALAHVARALEQTPDAAMLFSDEAIIAADGSVIDVSHKNGWNEALLLSHNTINHMTVFRTDLLRELGGLRLGYEGSQDHDLLLRCAARIDASRIRHIRHILYYWRVFPGSGSFSDQNRKRCDDARRRCVEDYLRAKGIKAVVSYMPNGMNRVEYRECPGAAYEQHN